MKSTIKLLKNDIELILKNIEPDKELIKVVLDRTLNNSKIDDYKIICDETNNVDEFFIYVDIILMSKHLPSSILLNFVLGVNNICELRRLRKKKINSIYNDNIKK